jgi:hypothetical protein
MIRVRPRRLLLFAIGAVGIGAGVVLVYSTPFPDSHLKALLRSIVLAPPFGLGVWTASWAFRRSLLTFDPATGILRGPSPSHRIGVYPRPHRERIEYDSGTRRLYEVGPRGEKRIWIPHWAARERDWDAFAEHLPPLLPPSRSSRLRP